MIFMMTLDLLQNAVSWGIIIPNSKLAITRITAPKIVIDVLLIISNDRIT